MIGLKREPNKTEVEAHHQRMFKIRGSTELTEEAAIKKSYYSRYVREY